MPSRKQWTEHAASILMHAGISSARLDAEILASHALLISRTKLHASFDEPLRAELIPILDAAIELRATRVPLAYITGHKEFYGRLFHVTPDVLIPRPESESFIELLREVPRIGSIVDIGTGSGALAITASKELGLVPVTAVDISDEALIVAQGNALAHDANVTFVRGDLLANFSRPVHKEPLVVMANLPYVSKSWDLSPELEYEPSVALFAEKDGLELIEKLLVQSSRSLISGDVVLLESDDRQHTRVIKSAEISGFTHLDTFGLIQKFIRV